MTELLLHVIAWPTLGVALLVFGFAPGAALRLITLFYRRDDPRRRELLGELYAVPRIERPFWVAKQLEVAIFEGLRGRLRDWLTRQALRSEKILAEMDADKLRRERTRRASLAQARSQLVRDDPFASMVAEQLSSWRGRGWRGAQPEVPNEED